MLSLLLAMALLLVQALAFFSLVLPLLSAGRWAAVLTIKAPARLAPKQVGDAMLHIMYF